MPTLTDYPAAHSMDTTWFAVDADGCVAEFDSSEAGGVPDQAASGGGAGEPSFDVFYLDAARAVRVLAAPVPPMAEGETVATGERAPRKFDRPLRALVLVAPEGGEDGAAGHYREAPRAACEALLAEFEPTVLHERAPRVIMVAKPIAPARLTELAERRDVAYLWTEWDLHDLLDLPEGRDGVFHFRHDETQPGGGAGAYRRDAVPAEPMRLEHVPAPVREAVGALRLPVRFEQTPNVHLADHVPEARVMTWHETPLRDTPEARAAREERWRLERIQRAESARKQARAAGVALLVVLALGVLAYLLKRA